MVDEESAVLVDVSTVEVDDEVEAMEPISTGLAPTRESAKLTICQVSKVATTKATSQAATNLQDVMSHCLRPRDKRNS